MIENNQTYMVEYGTVGLPLILPINMLYCIILHNTVLFCTTLHFTWSYLALLHFIMLRHVALYYNAVCYVTSGYLSENCCPIIKLYSIMLH